MSSKISKRYKTSELKGKRKSNEGTKNLPESGSASSEREGSEIGEEELGKLIAALGEDGVDDIAQRMLRELYEDEETNKEDQDDPSKAQSSADVDSEGEDSGAEVGSQAAEKQDGGENGQVDIELDEASSVDEDAVPRQKITLDNKDALKRILDNIKLDTSLPWTETLSVTYPSLHDVDVSDDFGRELSFYKQALHSAEAARTLATSHALPFTRPSDYFAEMVKSDAHMERIRQRLLDESAGIKKGEEKRREREGKKFGKQVQVEKIRERDRTRKDLDERIKGLKRKHKGGTLDNTQGEDFEVALEETVTDRPAKRARMPRTKRDEKYGRGGSGSVGWRSKQNTRESTDQFQSGRKGGRGSRGSKGGRVGSGKGTKRLGKSRRQATKGK